MNRLVPILITIGIIIIGVIRTVFKCHTLKKRMLFTFSFRENFIEMANDFLKNGKISNELYSKCVQDINIIQMELGVDGLVTDFMDQLYGVIIHNYQLFTNIFDELRSVQGIPHNIIMMERASRLLGLCDDALQRHMGVLEFDLNAEKKRIFNPFTSFGVGIRCIIGFPINILYWSGIISSQNKGKVREGRFFKTLSCIITLIGLIASIITILLGWNQVSDYLNEVLKY